MEGPEGIEGCAKISLLVSGPGDIGLTDAKGVWVQYSYIGDGSFLFYACQEFAADIVQNVAAAVVINKRVAAGWDCRRWKGRY